MDSKGPPERAAEWAKGLNERVMINRNAIDKKNLNDIFFETHFFAYSEKRAKSPSFYHEMTLIRSP